MADVRRELGTIERIRWPILGAISNGDRHGDILYGSLGTIKGIRWPGWMDSIICDKASILSFFYRWNYYFLKLL